MVLLLALMPATMAMAHTLCRGLGSAELPTLQRVEASVWRVEGAPGEPDETNRGVTIQLVLVRDRDHLWLIGSGPTPAFGAALACAIHRALGRRVTDLVNTRAAPQLALGNVAFADARLWALPDVIDAMRVHCETCRQQLEARLGATGKSLRSDLIRVPLKRVAPEGVGAGRLGPFEWLALARVPAERVLVLRYRRSRVVVAQGLLWAGDVPDLRDTRSDTLLASLRVLRTWSAGMRVLGEQGEPSPASAVSHHIAYVESLRQAIEPRVIRGDVQGAAGVDVELPAFAGLPGYAARHPLNVQRVWREFERTIFR
jgi:hypothetical protein